MNEWLKIMLEEIRRKRRERGDAVAEHEAREPPARSPGRPFRSGSSEKERKPRK